MTSALKIAFALILVESFIGFTASISWSYKGEDNGPSKWAENFPLCGGCTQSPVDIQTNSLEDSVYDLEFKNYELSPDFQLTNNGHTAVATQMAEIPKLKIRLNRLGKKYTFVNLHFHWGSDESKGSEHIINNKTKPMEMHIVHINEQSPDPLGESDGLAVLAVFFVCVDEDNVALNPIIDGLSSIPFEDNSTLIHSFSLASLLPEKKHFYRYRGSLTTPPCSEAVVWNIFKKPVKISERQLNQFRAIYDSDNLKLEDNFRPIQPINGRSVFFQRRKCSSSGYL